MHGVLRGMQRLAEPFCAAGLSPHPRQTIPRRRILHRRLVVDIPIASESLDTDRIALIRDRTKFDYYANSLWTDRVPLLVQTLLVEAFENDGSIAQVGVTRKH